MCRDLRRRCAALVFAALMALATALPAMAADHMVSFEPASDDARRLTGRGVTVLFRTRLAGQRVTKLMATAVPATAELRPVSNRVLTGLKVVGMGQLYAIDPMADQGAAYIRAFCPGSTRAWLAFSRVSRYPLTVLAFGDDPTTHQGARACADMTFTFKGEWTLPGRGPPDPMEETRYLQPF